MTFYYASLIFYTYNSFVVLEISCLLWFQEIEIMNNMMVPVFSFMISPY